VPSLRNSFGGFLCWLHVTLKPTAW
jgi:hypothetical protein